MRNGFFGKLAGAAAVMGAAGRAAAAVDNGRRPNARDLGTLGIDPAGFPRTR